MISRHDHKLRLQGTTNGAFNRRKKESTQVGDYIRVCPSLYVYDDIDVDDLIKNMIEYIDEDDLKDILDEVIESTIASAHDYYTKNYYMENKI